LNQQKTEPWIPNQDERQVIRMLWSTVSKCAVLLFLSWWLCCYGDMLTVSVNSLCYIKTVLCSFLDICLCYCLPMRCSVEDFFFTPRTAVEIGQHFSILRTR